jgi:hypothetical protein
MSWWEMGAGDSSKILLLWKNPKKSEHFMFNHIEGKITQI